LWSKSERRRARCAQLPAFPELLAEIKAAIAELGGRVFAQAQLERANGRHLAHHLRLCCLHQRRGGAA